MPTAKLFKTLPPFPENVSTARLSRISLTKLISGDLLDSEELFQACKDDGFFLLDLYGAQGGENLLQQADKLFEVNKDLFDEGETELMKFCTPPPGVLGYNSLGSTTIESGLPDRFEWYVMSQDDLIATNPQHPNPRTIESNRSILKSYILNAYSVVSILLSHLDKHLCLPLGTLESQQRITQPSGTCIRMLRYPPQPENDRRTSLFGHTDVGTITLLFNIIGGLQILPSGLDSKEENWRYVRPEPGCMIVNLGDTMKEWTGGILRSNMHRVTYPPREQGNYTRYSVAYLVRPEGKASMKRLAFEGSLIKEAGEGEEEIHLSAEEWTKRKTGQARLGKDLAMSKDVRSVKAH